MTTYLSKDFKVKYHMIVGVFDMQAVSDRYEQNNIDYCYVGPDNRYVSPDNCYVSPD